MTEIKTPKRRGRKPKGGKVVTNIENNNSSNENYKPNIILHLKCKSVEPSFKNNIEHQNNDNINFKNCENIINDPIINNKDVWNKIKILNKDLHTNNIRSSNYCFWDTCIFNTEPIFIPQNDDDNNMRVYGSFCCPECAAAYIFSEHCDTSVKWERYSLLNKLYSPIYKYKENIKPAPDPRYLLNKYCGNLTIEEYRTLITNNKKQVVIINKPITNITPELYETNNDISKYKSSIQNKKFFS